MGLWSGEPIVRGRVWLESRECRGVLGVLIEFKCQWKVVCQIRMEQQTYSFIGGGALINGLTELGVEGDVGYLLSGIAGEGPVLGGMKGAGATALACSLDLK